MTYEQRKAKIAELSLRVRAADEVLNQLYDRLDAGLHVPEHVLASAHLELQQHRNAFQRFLTPDVVHVVTPRERMLGRTHTTMTEPGDAWGPAAYTQPFRLCWDD